MPIDQAELRLIKCLVGELYDCSCCCESYFYEYVSIFQKVTGLSPQGMQEFLAAVHSRARVRETLLSFYPMY